MWDRSGFPGAADTRTSLENAAVVGEVDDDHFYGVIQKLDQERVEWFARDACLRGHIAKEAIDLGFALWERPVLTTIFFWTVGI